ncbi:hypothetical protein EMCRGX_G013760 [Ephydatia muelleri]
MWRSHMSLHAQGLFPGGVPQTWLFEQDLFICPHCSQLVANSRVASHSRQCKVPPPISSAENDDIQSAPAIVPDLPTFTDVCQLRCPTLRFVPKKARPSYARALSSTLRSVFDENSEEAWLKLFMLPKCVLPSLKSKGRHFKHTPIKVLCDLWAKNEFSTLWNLAGSNARKAPSQQKHRNSKSLSDSVISLAKIGLHGKACRILLSDGLAPLNNSTWELLKSKHPSAPLPTPPDVSCTPLSLGSDFNILPIIFSFPKGTAAGPSGLRVQHLIDVAQIPLPISTGSSLRDIVNLLAAGKAPLSVARFLAGGSLTALNKFKDGSPPDIRPIAVGKTLRRLAGKCLCSLVKDKVSSFFEPHQFGVACSHGKEKVVHAAFESALKNTGDISLLRQVIDAIDADDDCLHLILQAWYLDDGVLAGPRQAVLRALSIIEDLGPPLDILGTPIGDYLYCTGFFAAKRAELTKLLSMLEDVSDIDPQVAFNLLRLCSGFYLTEAAWCQSQLSLRFGGFGLRSLSHHSSAAIIASFCSSGFATADNHHLIHVVNTFNSLVSTSDAISPESAIESPPSQRSLSHKLDCLTHSSLYDSASSANKARLLSASASLATSWVSVLPSGEPGLHFDPREFHTAISWWLGLETTTASCCLLCPEIALDPLGHHALSCRRGGDVVLRHNQLRDVFVDICHKANLGVRIEAGSALTPDLSRSRPADALVNNWIGGKLCRF